MLAFTRRAFALRRRYDVFRRLKLLPDNESAGAVTHWLDWSGAIITEAGWHDRERHALTVLLQTGKEAPVKAYGMQLVLVLNGGALPVRQELPAGEWDVVLDTTRPGAEQDSVAGAVNVAEGGFLLLESGATSTRPAP